MIQMEHLEGAYGINSLLWEERTFPDGGHYYYSPALGQVRLGAPPPHMKGGLLCDEQGLGKTVSVVVCETGRDTCRNLEETNPFLFAAGVCPWLDHGHPIRIERTSGHKEERHNKVRRGRIL